MRKVCLVLLVLASCTMTKPVRHDLAGTVVVPGCEIAPSHGQLVSVTDPDGNVVGVGTLEWSEIRHCNLDFQIPSLPERRSYTFSFASIPGKATYSLDRLNENDWSISIDRGTQPVVFGPTHCSKPSPFQVQQPGYVNVGVVAKGGKATAAVLEGLPFPARAEFKIIWRMTGSGPLNLIATGGPRSVRPLERREHPLASIGGHGSEWGTVFRFPAPGCYVVHAQRTAVSAYTKIAVR